MSASRQVSAEESRALAEASREPVRAPSFLRQLFWGDYDLDLLDSSPGGAERPEFRVFCDALAGFLREQVDPVAIDSSGQYPPAIIDGLRRLGAFGMKIETQYGGLGLSQTEYDRVMQLLGSYDANLGALLSAHQSIGVPRPLELFGTEAQKKKYLPRLAAGAISAFALTEVDVGSDPARLATTAERDGDDYILNGEKLWCTNGTFAELIVVMARHPDSGEISAFIVDTAAAGVEVLGRCHFMGLRALENGTLRFSNVRVSAADRIGAEGQGLKIALITLNTGRLALPASSVGCAKTMLTICRRWANERVQWGHPIGKHEAVAHKIADMAATTFAMEAVSDVAGRLAQRSDYDIRLEAAAAKEFNTTRQWHLIDDAMQVRGGRGYENETSLRARGEAAHGVERAMRDARINRIFEGSSEIMHLFIAREAVDEHLEVAGKLIDPEQSLGAKLRALPHIAAFYAGWYLRRLVGWARWPAYSEYGRLARHLRFAARSSRRLARATLHGMLVYRGGLQRKQAFLFRLVDVGIELFALTTAVLRAHRLVQEGHPDRDRAVALADAFARTARRNIVVWMHGLWHNDDGRKYRLAQQVLDGRYRWLEAGTVADWVAPETAAFAVQRRQSGGSETQPPAI